MVSHGRESMEGYSDVGQSSPTGDQAETEDRLIAGNDARDGPAANLLRDDSEGSADSASAELGIATLSGYGARGLSEVSNS